MGTTLPRLAEDLDTRDRAGVPLSRAQRVAANAAQATASGVCWGQTGKESAQRLLEAPEKASTWPDESPCQLRAAAAALDAQLPPRELHARLQPSPGRRARARGEGARASLLGNARCGPRARPRPRLRGSSRGAVPGADAHPRSPAEAPKC
ncbi:hypothetical protein NN561_002630 [Cricetulus griseus]